MTLLLQGYVDLPRHATGGFDHGDVDQASGRVFVGSGKGEGIQVIEL